MPPQICAMMIIRDLVFGVIGFVIAVEAGVPVAGGGVGPAGEAGEGEAMAAWGAQPRPRLPHRLARRRLQVAAKGEGGGEAVPEGELAGRGRGGGVGRTL